MPELFCGDTSKHPHELLDVNALLLWVYTLWDGILAPRADMALNDRVVCPKCSAVASGENVRHNPEVMAEAREAVPRNARVGRTATPGTAALLRVWNVVFKNGHENVCIRIEHRIHSLWDKV